MEKLRLRHKPWAKDEIERHPHIVIQQPAQHRGKWHELFQNDHPIYLEVGTGKGQFLTKMAQMYPNINFIGIEKYDSVIITALERAVELSVENVKFLNENVSDLLEFFAKGEIERVYINFTDPWPKKRHEKRRLTYESFLKMYEKVLVEHGEIHFKTDNQALFEYSLHSFSKYGLILNNVSLNLHESDIENNVMTEYEEKFSQMGQRIYRCEAVYRS